MLTVTRAMTVVFALGLALVASAAPTIYGPTGLINVPTADTLSKDAYNLNANQVEFLEDISYGFNFGIRENLEAGFTRLPNKNTVINLKYMFQPAVDTKTGIAVGVLDATDQVNTALYAVVTRGFSTETLSGIGNLRASLGLASSTDREQSALNSIFGGVSFDVLKKLTVMLEHDGYDINYGVRYPVLPALTAQAGMVGEDHALFVGLNYNGTF